MAKSDRHKKLRRQEKAKTQLTGGKKLISKSQNLYEPKLQAKKIVIREQLKTQGEVKPGEVVEATTRKKQNIKDILTALNHHNTNIKKDALGGLQELIASKQDVLIPNLDRILGKIASLTSETEDLIRKENLKVAEIIFAQISEVQVQPFWNLLLTHIKCCLTNLNPTIRYSCLSFLALLITYFPNLVAKSNQIILPNIMDLVCVTSPGSAGSTSKTKEDKSRLKVEIDTKERIRVLSLITACLELKDGSAMSASASTFRGNNPIVNARCHEITEESKSDSLNNEMYLGTYYPYGYQDFLSGNNKEIADNQFEVELSLVNGILNNSEISEASSSQTHDFWPQFVQSYIPLLCETWMEVRPSFKGQKSGDDSGFVVLVGSDSRGICSLPKTSVEILECIVTVMTKLIVKFHSSNSFESNRNGQLNLIRILRKSQGQNMKKYFFELLPFSAVHDTQKKTVTVINLQLFHVAAQLRLVDETLMTKFDAYIKSLMRTSNLDAKHLSLVLEIITLIHIPTIRRLLSNVINYGLNAGHFEIINSFLCGVLQLKNETSDANILTTIDWDTIVNQLIQINVSMDSEILKIFTLIGLRNLTNLKFELEKNTSLEKIKVLSSLLFSGRFAELSFSDPLLVNDCQSFVLTALPTNITKLYATLALLFQSTNVHIKEKSYLKEKSNSNEAWDKVVRLFHASGSLELINSLSLDVPNHISEIIKLVHV